MHEAEEKAEHEAEENAEREAKENAEREAKEPNVKKGEDEEDDFELEMARRRHAPPGSWRRSNNIPRGPRWYKDCPTRCILLPAGRARKYLPVENIQI